MKRLVVAAAAAFLGTAAAEAAPCPFAPEAATLRRVGHWELTNATGSWAPIHGPAIKATADLYVTRSAPTLACVQIAVSTANSPACAALELVAPGNGVTLTIDACSSSPPVFEALVFQGVVESARWRFQPHDSSGAPIFAELRYFAEDLAVTGAATASAGPATLATR